MAKLTAMFLTIFVSGLLLINNSFALVGEAKPKEQAQETPKGDVFKVVGEPGGPAFVEKESEEPAYIPGELIVKLKEGKSLGDIKALNDKYKIKSTRKVFKATAKAQERLARRLEQRQKKAPKNTITPKLDNIYLLKTENGVDILSVAEDYKKHICVEYAEPNYVFKVQMLPNDPYYSSSQSWGQNYDDLWGLKKLQCEQAWDITQGSDVIVAVVDTGIDYNHEDIVDNIWTNPGEVPGNGQDDDGNGYIDDYYGYDFAYYDSDPIDGKGHGTHCAGTIAAVGNNLIGVIGVAPMAKVMAVKGLNDVGSGGAVNLANSVRYAADMGADVISNSWGGGGYSLLIEEAVNYAYSQGCVVVAAAGNSNADVGGFHPASYTNVITVAASDQYDEKCYFSNYGVKIDVAAPGGNGPTNSYNILSLLAADSYFSNNLASYIVGSKYIRLAGTSMACPHVSGLSALLIAKNPLFTNEEIRQVIRSSADDIGELGWDLYYGFGRVNAYKALQKDSVCIAKINSPLPYASLAGKININGTAKGSNFKSYKIEYGAGNNPQDWTMLNAGNLPAEDQVLVSDWDTASLQDGDYTIKLMVTDIADNTYEDRTLIGVRNTYISSPQTGDFVSAQGDVIEIRGTAGSSGTISFRIEYFRTNDYGSQISPMVSVGVSLAYGGSAPVANGLLATLDTSVITQPGIYTFRLTKNTPAFTDTYDVVVYLDPLLKNGWPKMIPTETKMVYSPLTLADINNDGKAEILFGYENKVYVFDYQGELLTGWPQEVDSNIQESPVAADLDGDGFMEIVSGRGKYAWRHDGTLLAGWPNIQLGGKTIIDDIDSDGNKEIVIVEPSEVDVVDINGGYLPGWPVSPGTQWSTDSTGVVGDIDNDGKKEIVVMAKETTWGNPKIFIFSYDGTYQAIGPQFNPGQYYLSLGDLDNDNDLEIMIRRINSGPGTIDVLHHDGSNLAGWPVAISHPYGYGFLAINPPTLSDMDGDGRPEIIIGAQDSERYSLLYTFRYDGSLVQGGPLMFGRRPVWINLWSSYFGCGAVSAGDLDSDGNVELIVSENSPYLRMIRIDGTEMPGVVLRASNVGGNADNPPALGDIDGDGKIEVAWLDNSGRIFVWDLPGDYAPEKIEWGQYQHDAGHTGFYTTDTVAPSAPTYLVASAVSSSRIDLSWQASTDNLGVVGYRIYRDTGFVATSSTTSYSDTELMPSTSYTYRVAAYDAAGNPSQQSAAASATTQAETDTIAPTTIDSGIDGEWHNSPVIVSLIASDNDSGVNSTYYSLDGSTPTLVYAGPFTVTPDGIYSVKYYSVDRAGNAEIIKTAANQLKIDKVAPAGSISINGGDNTTNSTAVILNLLAQDALSGVFQMQFSNDNSVWSTPEAYAATKNWTLTAGEGIKTVYAKFSDVAGSWSGAYPDTITVTIDPVGDSQTPWKSNESGTLVTDMNWNYLMGYHFTPQQSGQITKLGGFFNGIKTVYLWNEATGELLVQAPVPSSNSWSYTSISPVTVQAGQTYTVAAYLAGSGGTYRYSIASFPQTYGAITIEGSTYLYGQQGRPINYITNYMYGQVDIEFVPSGGPVNQPPVLNPLSNQTVDEGQYLEFMISATDPDGDTVNYEVFDLPQGATTSYIAGPDGGIRFQWTPTHEQAGTYVVDYTARDAEFTIPGSVTITVNNVNRAPVLDLVGNKSVNEGQLLEFTVTASDPDNDALALSASNLPSGASFNSSTGVFSWTPGSGQAGTYSNVRFQVSDGSLVDYENITITVQGTSDSISPVVSITGPNDGASIKRKSSITISATASDNVGVTRVEFRVNGGLISTDTSAPYSCSWSLGGSPNATYTIEATAYDAAGNSASDAVTVYSSK